MSSLLSPRLGFEIELIAPAGSSRLALAQTLAEQSNGTYRPFFHQDTELSLVKGRPVFHHLSRGFVVFDSDGTTVCRLVDDVTIVDDLDATRAPESDWYRVLSDDTRLIRLADDVCDPADSSLDVLKPLAAIFGVPVTLSDTGRPKVTDRGGASIAMVAAQGAERERVCEIITPPLADDRADRLDDLLTAATSLGFTVPFEAAVHVHLDAEPWRDAARLADLVRVFSTRRDEIWDQLGTNQACRRLGPIPEDVAELCASSTFRALPWAQAEARLRTAGLGKYLDLNLTNLLNRTPGKDTVEIRVLPGSISTTDIMANVETLETLVGAA